MDRPKSLPPLPSSPRRPRLKGLVAAVATASLTLMALPPATAAETDQSEALAQVISSELLGLDLLETNTTLAGNPSDPAPAQNQLDASVLDAVEVDLGTVTVPLISQPGGAGLLDLGEAGLLKTHAIAPSTSSSTASAGALEDNGSLSVDPGGVDTTRSASVSLTPLLDQVGVDGLTDDIVDELTLDLGALGSTATADGSTASSEYMVADGRLIISSPLMGGLATDLDTAIAGAGPALGDTLAADGTLGQVATDTEIGVDLLGGTVAVEASGGTIGITPSSDPAYTDTLEEALANASATLLTESIEDSNGLVSINLQDGTIAVDLKQVTGTDSLNGLDPNYDLLSPTNIDAITDAVGEALGDYSTTVGEVVEDELLNTVGLQIELPASVTATVLSADVTIEVETTLGELAGTAPSTPEINIEGDLLGIIDAEVLELGLLDGVVADLVTPLQGVIDEAVAGVTTGLTTTLDTAIDPAIATLSPVLNGLLTEIVTVTINHQPTLLEPGTGYLGEASFTVNALRVELLPELLGGPDAVALDLASSTVRAAAAATPVLNVDPETVADGETTTVTGSGYPAETEVSVQLTDAAGTPVGDPVTVTTDADGVFSTPLTVPAGTTAGDFEVVGTATSGETASDALAVTNADVPAEDPVVSVEPAAVQDGDSTTVTGEGYPPSTEVTVQLEDADGNPVGDPVTVTTDENGEFTTDLPVPAGTEAGDYVVDATAATGETATDDLAVTNADVPVTEPVLGVNPGVVVDGGTTEVTGSGYPAETEVSVQLTDAAGTPVGDPVAVTTDAEGGFVTDLTVPADTPAGDFTVVGTATSGETAADALAVTTADVPVTDPVVWVDPAMVEDGESTTVTGEGYPPSTEVTVQLEDADGNPVGDPVTVTTDENGAFSTDLPVPEGTEAGDYVVDATAETGETATDDLAVTNADVPVTEPVLGVDPGTVPDGGTTEVTGSSYPAETDVSVQLTGAAGTPVGDPVVVTTDADGDFVTDLTVPAGTPAGAFEVVGTATSGETAADALAVTTADAPGTEDPVVWVDPGVVEDGDSTTVTGEDFPPNTEVEVQLTDPEDNPVGDPVTVVTDENGDFAIDLPVPEGTEAGDYVVDASAETGETATDELAVTNADSPTADPVVWVDPGVVQDGESTEVTGAMYPPNTEVTVQLEDADGNPVGGPVTVTTDENGEFTADLPVPEGAGAGDYTVDATAETGETATDALAVTNADVTADDPTVSVDPGTVEDGESTTVTGEDFPPNTEVEVQLTDPEGNPVGDPVTVVTDENGDFTAEITAPEGTDAGDYTVDATAETGETASADLTVTAGAGNGGADDDSDDGTADGDGSGDGTAGGDGTGDDWAGGNGSGGNGSDSDGSGGYWYGGGSGDGSGELARTGAAGAPTLAGLAALFLVAGCAGVFLSRRHSL